MNVNQVRRLMDKGFSVVIENMHTGATERYTPTGNGMWVVTYNAIGICFVCGKPDAMAATSRFSNCRCDQTTLKQLSMVDAYRSICGMELSNASVNQTSQKLTLTNTKIAV